MPPLGFWLNHRLALHITAAGPIFLQIKQTQSLNQAIWVTQLTIVNHYSSRDKENKQAQNHVGSDDMSVNSALRANSEDDRMKDWDKTKSTRSLRPVGPTICRSMRDNLASPPWKALTQQLLKQAGVALDDAGYTANEAWLTELKIQVVGSPRIITGSISDKKWWSHCSISSTLSTHYCVLSPYPPILLWQARFENPDSAGGVKTWQYSRVEGADHNRDSPLSA
jgi:hypothetical protein